MDPNNSRPMSYDSLKILLQYAKPNLRFELFRRIPSIRLTEKTVPLRLNSLRIGGHGVEINNTYYEARIIRYFPPSGIVPRGFRFDNLSNDGEWDLDEWGFDDYSSENIITPGDLVLHVQEHNHGQRIQNETKKDLENRLEYVEWIIAKKSGGNVESEWTGEAIDTVSINWMENSTLIEVKSEVERIKIRLAPYNCLENNVPLPFIKMVQVTVNTENGNLCWRYSGNLKCYEIRKQLMTWLLGNRKPVIQVNYFTVINGIIARLPENLRICIKKLNTTFLSERNMVDMNTMMNKLEAILQQNHPLDAFETDSIEEDFDHPLATTAKKLIISEDSVSFPDANRLIRIPNQKMYIHAFMLEPGSFYPGHIIQLIRDWIENPREIGKCLSFEGREKRVMETMTQIQATFDGIKAKRSMKIPVDNFSQISVFYESQVFMMRRRRIRKMTIEVVAV